MSAAGVQFIWFPHKLKNVYCICVTLTPVLNPLSNMYAIYS